MRGPHASFLLVFLLYGIGSVALPAAAKAPAESSDSLPDRPRVTAFRTETPPAIDGRIDEADCVTSAETEAKLRDDIAWALQHDIKGAPLLLVNGREAPASLEFPYAMVLAKANPEHPAFAVLPPPQPQARLR